MKHKDYPGSVLEEKVNSVDVKIIGVDHEYDFLKKHYSFFEEKISESDAIMLEQVIGGDFWDSDFFGGGGLGGIAHSQRKKVYQADPNTPLSLFVGFPVQTALGAALAGYSIFNMYDIEKILPNLVNLGIGLYSFAGGLFGFCMRAKIKYEKYGEAFYGLDDLLLYGQIDFRNVMIAEGIDKICHEIPEIKKLSCFHGDAHSHHIKTYLKNSKLRNIKKILYTPYWLLSHKKVREYTPVGSYCYDWQLSKEI